jgi:16S rRNA (uracil1498-N3)-methyltransferase
MADRYFVETPIAGGEARLVGAEAHHLAHVLRAKSGDEVTLFDGGGAEFPARVERVGRSEIELTVLSRQAVDRETRVRLTLGVALPKGDRQRFLVEKAVELGVARLVPLQTERSVDRETPSALERLRRAVIEASKQCGRNRLMEIATPRKLVEYLADPTTTDMVRLFAHPDGKPFFRACETSIASGDCPNFILAVGPEGGFTNSELKFALSEEWEIVGCGERILRVETAALALAAGVMLLSSRA